MQKLYSSNYRRPSLRFLQRDVDRKQEQTRNRNSARLSKAFQMRNLSVPKETFVIEELPEVPSGADASGARTRGKDQRVPDIQTNPEAGPKPQITAARKANVDLQKEKLQRWKEEQKRKKELATNNRKKPFLNAVHLTHALPKFLTGVSFSGKENVASKIPKATSVATRTFTLRPRPNQAENRPPPPPSFIPRTTTGKVSERTQGSKTKTAPLMSSNIEKTGSKDLFSANISRIRPVEDLRVESFAPKNFMFTGLPHLRKESEMARRSSTPIKDATSTSGLKKMEVDLRRSQRLQAKDKKDSTPVSEAAGVSDGTFVVPKTAKHITRLMNRVSLLPTARESAVGCCASPGRENLIDFSDL